MTRSPTMAYRKRRQVRSRMGLQAAGVLRGEPAGTRTQDPRLKSSITEAIPATLPHFAVHYGTGKNPSQRLLFPNCSHVCSHAGPAFTRHDLHASTPARTRFDRFNRRRSRARSRSSCPLGLPSDDHSRPRIPLDNYKAPPCARRSVRD
jgi:hypothetical protein